MSASAQEMLGMLGIDVSKETLDAALADPSTRAILWDLRVPNSLQGVGALVQRTPPEVAWVVEPTGPYSLLVVQQGGQAGRRVLLAPTRKARKYAESHQTRALTDKSSARSLALFGLDRQLTPFPLKSPEVDEIEQLLRARRGVAQAITDLDARARDLPYVRQSLQASVRALKEHLAQLDASLRSRVSVSSVADLGTRLQAVEGVGVISSSAFAARLVSKDFVHPDKWVAYCGMDIAVRQSGKRKGEKGLTHEGDAELRRLAYVCAQAAVRTKGSPFRKQFEREREKGRCKVAAYCAVARKILKVVWALHHSGGTYDPSLVGISPQERRARLRERQGPEQRQEPASPQQPKPPQDPEGHARGAEPSAQPTNPPSPPGQRLRPKIGRPLDKQT